MSKEKRTIYKIRIVYKSGYTHDFETYKFSYEKTYGGSVSMEWESVDPTNKPVIMGLDDIAAVWQIGVREEDDE